MKKLLVWVFIGAVVFTFVGRHRRAAVAYDNRPARLERQSNRVVKLPVRAYDPETGDPIDSHIVVAYRDDQSNQRPSPPKRPNGPRERVKTVPAPAPKVEAPKVDPKALPDWFPKNAEDEATAAKVDDKGYRTLVSGLAGSETKARADLRLKVEREMTQWLAGDVATGWKPSSATIDRMIKATFVKPVIEDAATISKDFDELVTLYRAGARVDFSPAARDQMIAAYNQEIVRDRTIKGGSILGFVLVLLAALSGYIRADEATKGFYTNRLRILTAGAVGAAGVGLYHLLV